MHLVRFLVAQKSMYNPKAQRVKVGLQVFLEVTEHKLDAQVKHGGCQRTRLASLHLGRAVSLLGVKQSNRNSHLNAVREIQIWLIKFD